MTNIAWNDHEFRYCRDLVRTKGDGNVGHDPKSIASYLRLQAASAHRDGEYEISSSLGYAATAINCDARNNHAPDFPRALAALETVN